MYWIDGMKSGRLCTAARPRAGDWLEDEIALWSRSGVDHVVSLLERDEIEDLDLGDEAAACMRAGLSFSSYPIPDRGLPYSPEEVTRLVEALSGDLAAGRGVLIHCRAGIGRSSMIAAAVCVFAGATPAEAFQRISAARGLRTPDTEQQIQWVEAFAERLSG